MRGGCDNRAASLLWDTNTKVERRLKLTNVPRSLSGDSQTYRSLSIREASRGKGCSTPLFGFPLASLWLPFSYVTQRTAYGIHSLLSLALTTS